MYFWKNPTSVKNVNERLKSHIQNIHVKMIQTSSELFKEIK